MNTDNLLLILIFVFSQNKQLMEDMRPVLDFLEEHKNAVAVLQQMLDKKENATSSSSYSADASASPWSHAKERVKQTEEFKQTEQPWQHEKPQKTQAQQTEQPWQKEKTQSPLEGIANEFILNSIKNYLANQAK